MIYAEKYISKKELRDVTAPISTLSNGMKAVEHAVLIHEVERQIGKLGWSIIRRRNMLSGLDLVTAVDLHIEGAELGSMAIYNSHTGHNALKVATGIGYTEDSPLRPNIGVVLDIYQAPRRTYGFSLETWIPYILGWALGSMEENKNKIQQMDDTTLTQSQVDLIIMEASRGSRLHKLSWSALRKVHDLYHEKKGSTSLELALAFGQIARTVSPVLQMHAGYRFSQMLLPRKKSRKSA